MKIPTNYEIQVAAQEEFAGDKGKQEAFVAGVAWALEDVKPNPTIKIFFVLVDQGTVERTVEHITAELQRVPAKGEKISFKDAGYNVVDVIQDIDNNQSTFVHAYKMPIGRI